MSEYQIDYDTAVKELSEAKVEGNIVVFIWELEYPSL